MKTFVLTTFIPKQAVDLLGEKPTQNQCQAMVAALTRKDVIASFNAAGIECTAYKLKQYAEDVTGHLGYEAVAKEKPNQVFVRRLSARYDDPWFECPPVPRHPRADLTPMKHPAREGRRNRYEAFRAELIDEIQGYPI